MKNRIEYMIKLTEQLHAEALVADLNTTEMLLSSVLTELYWLYKHVCELGIE